MIADDLMLAVTSCALESVQYLGSHGLVKEDSMRSTSKKEEEECADAMHLVKRKSRKKGVYVSCSCSI